MLRVGSEPTIPASKRSKTVHVLDHSTNVTGRLGSYSKVSKKKVKVKISLLQAMEAHRVARG
jgi:hypothetical protein